MAQKRSKDLPAFRLTERDLKLIKTVYMYRAMTTPQIADLLFPGGNKGRLNVCRERLKKLTAHGFLWRGEIPVVRTEGRLPFVYRLDNRGADWLPEIMEIEASEIDWSSRERTISDSGLNHLIKTNDVRTVIEVATSKTDFSLRQWIDERNLRRTHADDKVTITGPQGQIKEAVVIPDGFFELRDQVNKRSSYYFLEIDLKTETGRTTNPEYRDWTRKIKAYLAYYHTDLFERRYKAKNFRVLTVTTSPKRLQNLQEKTEDVGGKNIFWFTTFDQLTPETVFTEPIWFVASMSGNHCLVKK